MNETRIDSHITLVAKHGNLIYSQTTRCDICESNKLVEDECVYKILTHQLPTCPLVRTQQTLQVNEITKGIILVDTTEDVEIEDSCGNSKMVRETTIIETGNCTIRIRNLTFSGKPDVSHQDEYLIPIYSKPLQTTNYTNNEEENFLLRIQNLEQLSEIQISLNRTHKRVTFGGILLLAITSLCFFAVFLYRKTQLTKNKHIKPPELLKTKQIGEADANTKTTADTAKKVIEGNHTRTALADVLKTSNEDVRYLWGETLRKDLPKRPCQHAASTNSNNNNN